MSGEYGTLSNERRRKLKVNVTAAFHDLDGIPLRDSAVRASSTKEIQCPHCFKLFGEPGPILRPERDFTLRKACTEALQALNLTGDTQDGEERYKRYLLAVKIMSNDSPDLSIDEIAKLKRLIGLAFGAVVVGRAYEILDPAPSVTPT